LELNRTGNPFGNNGTWDEATTFELHTITKTWKDPGKTDSATLFGNWGALAISFNATLAGSASYTPGKLGWFSFNVQNVVKDFVKDSSTNFGLMLFSNGHVNSSNGGCLSKFSSPVDATSSLRPKLSITYTIPVSIINIKSVHPHNVTINALNRNGFRISSSRSFTADITVCAMDGSVVNRLVNRHIAAGNTAVLFTKSLKNGVYLLKVTGKGVSVGSKMVIPGVYRLQ